MSSQSFKTTSVVASKNARELRKFCLSQSVCVSSFSTAKTINQRHVKVLFQLIQYLQIWWVKEIEYTCQLLEIALGRILKLTRWRSIKFIQKRCKIISTAKNNCKYAQNIAFLHYYELVLLLNMQ